MVKVWGQGFCYLCFSIIIIIYLFIILFGSRGKISTGTLSCFLLQLQYLSILFYFIFLYLTNFIF